jgi:phosphoribosyl-ATP pyrophosphohydrolase
VYERIAELATRLYRKHNWDLIIVEDFEKEPYLVAAKVALFTEELMEMEECCHKRERQKYVQESIDLAIRVFHMANNFLNGSAPEKPESVPFIEDRTVYLYELRKTVVGIQRGLRKNSKNKFLVELNTLAYMVTVLLEYEGVTNVNELAELKLTTTMQRPSGYTRY